MNHLEYSFASIAAGELLFAGIASCGVAAKLDSAAIVQGQVPILSKAAGLEYGIHST